MIDAPKSTDQDAGTQLLANLKETMAAARPLISDSMKVTSDIGQLTLKTLCTLNAGGILAAPALVKIFWASGSMPTRGLMWSCIFFAIGLILAVTGALTAFVASALASRRLALTLMLPVMQTQERLFPGSFDQSSSQRYEAAKLAAATSERKAAKGLTIIVTIGISSAFALILGVVEAARLIAFGPTLAPW